MDDGQNLADEVELNFAKRFEDFKDMSTMVGLTQGASCLDVGISKVDCHE